MKTYELWDTETYNLVSHYSGPDALSEAIWDIVEIITLYGADSPAFTDLVLVEVRR